ncbi:MAG: protein-L-isoaspartate(D-aspartate) O-methyltransferase [Breznakibacter sp.]|nr:protein-L-isoaspartate(D-aspartate) O-methyltransferase [Breznakibacter sp.]
MLRLLVVMVLFFIQGKERQSERESMLRDQIEGRGITHRETIRAMRVVERHRLIPEDQVFNAYKDGPLPIGYGQTISQPYIVAYMTQAINPKKDNKILEIGTGSGYQAAVLAEIVDQVYSVEIIKPLGERAKRDLDLLGYKNIHIKIGDGYYGWEEFAPYDAIVVTAASEFVPPPLLAQLKDGGKMIIPVGSSFITQQLVLVEKRGDRISSRNLLPVRFVPFIRAANDP